MKKLLSTIFALLLLVLSIASTNTTLVNAASDGIPYETYTLGANGNLTHTQTAYIPYGILNQNDVVLNGPKDMYLYKDELYIADTGNKRIAILNEKGNLVNEIKHDGFVEPTGVFVNENGVYIADRSAGAVFKFDSISDSEPFVVGRPKEQMFGKTTPYTPIKISVASSGLMYIVGEGCTNGVITINEYGEFMGFTGINTTTFSLRKYIYNFFVGNASLAGQKPSAPTNITIGANGNIFTTNAANVPHTFKRLNISGNNTLGADTYYPGTDENNEITDIAISEDNYIYLSTEAGDIYEYDSTGKLLFTFSTKDTGLQNVLGLTQTIDGIEISSKGNIYALDSKTNKIQMYERTAFVNILHKAVDMYNDGRYLESKELWQSVLKENSNFALAHTALGWSYFKEDNFDAALKEFHLAKNYSGYSDVYWEIRNEFLQQYTGYVLLGLIVLYVIYKVAKFFIYKDAIVTKEGTKIPLFVDKIQKNYASKEHSKFVTSSVTLMKEVKYSFSILKKPSDTCYGVKRQGKASYKSAIVILVLFILTYLLSTYVSAFLFKSKGDFGNAMSTLLIIVAVFTLWCLVNYLVATLNDGEGWFKDIFIVSCYSLIPYIIIKLPMILVSYALTYNEAFIMDMVDLVAYGWCIILIIYSILNIHNYSLKETLKNLVISIFGMLLIAFTLLLVYMFMAQLVDFVTSIIKEVFSRG